MALKKRDPFQWVLLVMVLVTMMLSYMIYSKLDKKEKYSDCGQAGAMNMWNHDCCKCSKNFIGVDNTPWCSGGDFWEQECNTRVCAEIGEDGNTTVNENCVRDCIESGSGYKECIKNKTGN